MIEKQREVEGDAYVSTILFNQYSAVLHDRVPLEKIKKMELRDFVPGGTTALIDAIGDAIKHIRNIHKYARKSDVPKKTIFVITTDGMENASSKYTASEVKKMIQEQTQKQNWEFIYLAANIDAVESAGSIGIRRERALNYEQSSEGYDCCYSFVNECLSMSRTSDNEKELDMMIEEFRRNLDDGK